jgi:type VI secretion system protein VasG
MKEGELSPALQNALDKFTLDVTAKAKEGKIDPVFGRDTEIRQMVDILSRRRKTTRSWSASRAWGKPHWLKVWHCVLPRAMCLNR